MSCSQRAVARLPLHIFTDLDVHAGEPLPPLQLRAEICQKLIIAGRKHHHKGVHMSSAIGARTNQSSISGVDTNTPAGITTVGQLLRLTPPALLRALDPLLIHDECKELIRRICATCCPKSKTAKELLSHQKVSSILSPNATIPSDVSLLDKCLRGGFRIGTVTEIVGRSGVGKTQLAMQLCVVAARLNFGSIFVDTEKKLSMERLNEIANQRHRMNMNYKSANNVLNNVTIHRISSTSELLSAISKLDEEIILRNEQSEEEVSVASHGELDKYPVKLLIVDSIAAPTRRDFGGGDAPKRVAAIFQIAQQLKYIADQMQVAVVVINQIEKVDDHQRFGSIEEIVQYSDGVDRDFLSSKAALGTSWHHCVSTRLALEYSRNPHQDNAIPNLSHYPIENIRTATVMKSNVVGRSSTTFQVAKNGICECRSHIRRQEE